MAHQIILAYQARRHNRNSQTADFINIRRNRTRALGIILTQLLRSNILGIDNSVIQELCTDMVNQRLHMVISTVAVGFAGLCHNIADVNFDCLRPYNSITDSLNQKVGNNTGIQAARSENKHIGI